MKARRVRLECPKCKRHVSRVASFFPDVPASVMRIAVICPRCDDGDFHAETWFDDAGKEISQDSRDYSCAG
jgi:hypothetical protein